MRGYKNYKRIERILYFSGARIEEAVNKNYKRIERPIEIERVEFMGRILKNYKRIERYPSPCGQGILSYAPKTTKELKGCDRSRICLCPLVAKTTKELKDRRPCPLLSLQPPPKNYKRIESSIML